MGSSTPRMSACVIALVGAGLACEVSPAGLGPLTDGSTGGAGGDVVCPSGLVDHASWPAKFPASSCSRWCGPDDVGLETCGQTSRGECQKESGCVCLVDPCVTCGRCAFLAVPECYVPTNAATATFCPAGVARGAPCGPACGRQLCLQHDGKTACLCNRDGKYACADWDGASWL